MPEGHDTTNEVCNMSFVLYTQILKQSVLKPASPGITLSKLCSAILRFRIEYVQLFRLRSPSPSVRVPFIKSPLAFY